MPRSAGMCSHRPSDWPCHHHGVTLTTNQVLPLYFATYEPKDASMEEVYYGQGWDYNSAHNDGG